jgi:biotin transport system substrate-specific component
MGISLKELLLAALFAGLTAVGAFIRIPFPVVPLTLHMFVVFLAGLYLGPKVGMFSQWAYLLLGLSGVPVFSGGGGVSYVLSPTFGYLLSYPFAAWIAGRIAYGGPPTLMRNLRASLSALLLVYLLGTLVLSLNLNFIAGKDVSPVRAIQIAVLPFIVPDMLKALAASLLALRLRAANGAGRP